MNSPHNDIHNIWSNIELRSANEWGTYSPQQKFYIAQNEPYIDAVARQIEKDREEFRRIMDRALNNPIDRFIDNFMIPVTVFATQQSPYGRVAMAFATTARAVAPKLGQIATSIGATAAFQRYSTFLSQKASGGDPKPRAGTEGRKIDTQADRDNFIRSKLESGEYKKYHKLVDGKPTWANRSGDRFYQKSKEGWEIEVYNERGNHIGVIKPSTRTFHPEFAVKGRRINVK